MFGEEPETQAAVIAALTQVRDSGQTNMLAVADVKSTASDLGLDDLVAYCDEVMAMEPEAAAERWITAVLEMGDA